MEKMQGYYPLVENEVYANEFSLTSETGKEVPIMRLILPRRYRESSENDVIDYLQKVAEKVEPFALLHLPGGSDNQVGKSLLEKAVIALPDVVRRHIRTGDENCIEFIRGHTMARSLEDGETPREYLFVRYGLVPINVIDNNREAGNIKDASWYETALLNDELREMGLGEKFNVRILLQDYTLPAREEMEMLLRHGVHGSRTLEVSRTSYPLDRMNEVMDFLYHNFSTPEKIDRLNDISTKVLEELAFQPVMALHKKVKEAISSQRND